MFRTRLSLAMFHEFYGELPAPISLHPADPAEFKRHGLILRGGPDSWRVAGETAAEATTLLLDLRTEDPTLVTVTQGLDWQTVPTFKTAVPSSTNISISTPSAVNSRFAIGALSKTIARLQIDLPPLGDAQQETDMDTNVLISMNAVRSVWTYHVVARELPNELSIKDPAEQITFAAIGEDDLPDGRKTRQFRASASIQAAARGKERFRLEANGEGPKTTLIKTLPVAGDQMVRGQGTENAAEYTSDIYITL